MDNRFKIIEIRRFFKNLVKDYRSGLGPPKKEKRRGYLRMTKLLFMNIWNGISAPFIYPVWYLFRKSITNKIYKGTSWEEINSLIIDNKTAEVKSILKKNGKFLYWLWTYGDLRDPLGAGELTGQNIKNNFWNRFWENAVRNVRFTINFMEFRTGEIILVFTAIDNRNFSYMHNSDGIGDSSDGIYFKWMLDTNNRWGFIYEDNNEQNIFYFGNVGLLKKDIGSNGRFEVSYRKTDSSYKK
jgi:hypothetical protein